MRFVLTTWLSEEWQSQNDVGYENENGLFVTMQLGREYNYVCLHYWTIQANIYEPSWENYQFNSLKILGLFILHVKKYVLLSSEPLEL